MTDMDRLIAAVEAGDGPGNHVFALVEVDHVKWCIDAWRGSLDAALRLHEALLPGWEWWTHSLHYWEGDEGPVAILRTGTPGVDLQVASARSATPARAWLLAILRAVKARGE